jgi:hypothetical protein
MGQDTFNVYHGTPIPAESRESSPGQRGSDDYISEENSTHDPDTSVLHLDPMYSLRERVNTGASEMVSLITAEADSPWAQKTVLSLDGGGVRSYSSLLILERLMQKIEDIERVETPPASSSTSSALIESETTADTRMAPAQVNSGHGFLPCHYFDYIAGTSSGGLVAIMLGRLRLSVSAVMDEYTKFADEIFGNPGHASIPGFGHLFKTKTKSEMFATQLNSLRPSHSSPDEAEKRFESDSTRCRTIVCSMERDNAKRVMMPFLFRSYAHGNEDRSPFNRNPGGAAACDISQVAQAAIAAPHRFRSVVVGDHKYFDAGLGLNNPSSEVYNEVNLMHPHFVDPISIFVSLGCGYARANEARHPDGSRAWKLKLSRKKLEQELSSISDSVHEQMEKESKLYNFQYYRLDVKHHLGDNVLYEWKKIEPGRSALARIKNVTMIYLGNADVDSALRKCALELVSRRRQRAETMQWESFALGTRYRCRHPEPCDAKKRGVPPFSNRNELLDHLRMHHKLPPPDTNNHESIKSLLDQGRTSSD